jgi:hypothetical protein
MHTHVRRIAWLERRAIGTRWSRVWERYGSSVPSLGVSLKRRERHESDFSLPKCAVSPWLKRELALAAHSLENQLGPDLEDETVTHNGGKFEPLAGITRTSVGEEAFQ